jgi:hypothetical protein
MERKIKILMISTVVVLAALSGIAVMAYANGVTNDMGTAANVTCNCDGQYYAGRHTFFARQAFGYGHAGAVAVSQEFRDDVVNITESDPDVQKLLADGYNITGVRPIVNATVEADGTVTMKATSAIVVLRQNTTGRASVWVNLEEGKVMRIVILTRTVIEKP